MAKRGYDEVVLVTGLPSLLATRTCEELLRASPRTLVYVLARESERAAIEAALEAIEARRRVVILGGDPTSIDLGLSGAELTELAQSLDVIHHAATSTRSDLERDEATTLNVVGTREVVEVASLARGLRCLLFHSSASVSGTRTGVVREDDLGDEPRSPVEESLARAEKLLRGKAKDVPIVVVRPAMIVGDSETGVIDRFDGPYPFIELVVGAPPDMTLPLPGRGDTLLNLVPIDHVVRAARAFAKSPAAIGKTFHVVDPEPLPAQTVFDLVAAASGRRGPRPFLPPNLAKALLLTKSPRALALALATPVTYDDTNARAILGPAGIRCPPFPSYVDRLVAFVRSRNVQEAS